MHLSSRYKISFVKRQIQKHYKRQLEVRGSYIYLYMVVIKKTMWQNENYIIIDFVFEIVQVNKLIFSDKSVLLMN